MGICNSDLDYDVYTSIVLRRHVNFLLREQEELIAGHNKRRDSRTRERGDCIDESVLEGANGANAC